MSYVDRCNTTGYGLNSFSVTADDAAGELPLNGILPSSVSLDNLPGTCPVDHVRLSSCDNDLLESTVNMSGRLGDPFSVVDAPFQVLPGSSSMATQILALPDAESLVEHSLSMSVSAAFSLFGTTLPDSFASIPAAPTASALALAHVATDVVDSINSLSSANDDTELASQVFENLDHSTCISPSHWTHTSNSTVSVDPADIQLEEGGDDDLFYEQVIVVQIQEGTPMIADPSDQLDDSESTEHAASPSFSSETTIEFSCDFSGVAHSSLANAGFASSDSHLDFVDELNVSEGISCSANAVICHDMLEVDESLALPPCDVSANLFDVSFEQILSDSFDDIVETAVATSIIPLFIQNYSSEDVNDSGLLQDRQENEDIDFLSMCA